MFGDAETIEEQFREQFAPYVNRFGSGLVIYWFGYVAEQDDNSGRGVKLALDVPDADHITRFDPHKVLESFLKSVEKKLEQPF